LFYTENGEVKARVLFKSEMTANGVYLGSLHDGIWSDVDILSSNNSDSIPALFNSFIIFARNKELYAVPIAVAKDIVSGSFQYRYSADITLDKAIATLGNVARVVIYWTENDKDYKHYFDYRLNDTTEWTAIGNGDEIPGITNDTVIHLRGTLYSEITGKYIASNESCYLIFYSPEARTWSEEVPVDLSWESQIGNIQSWADKDILSINWDDEALTVLGMYEELKAFEQKPNWNETIENKLSGFNEEDALTVTGVYDTLKLFEVDYHWMKFTKTGEEYALTVLGIYEEQGIFDENKLDWK
jgi:hypothetical protein